MALPRAVKVLRLLIFGVVAVAIFAIGFGEAVLHLWNWLMPALFGLHTIGYWQALGLLGLCWILFGGHRGFMGPQMRMRQRMRERWANMTPEEREKLRAGMRARCGGFGATAAEPKA